MKKLKKEFYAYDDTGDWDDICFTNDDVLFVNDDVCLLSKNIDGDLEYFTFNLKTRKGSNENYPFFYLKDNIFED